MTREELLKEAKRRYPIGTEYVCPTSLCSNLVESDDYKVIDESTVYGNAGCGCLMFEGKWAKIVNYPPFKYNIGDIINTIEGGKQCCAYGSSDGITGIPSNCNKEYKIIDRKYNFGNWYKLENHGNWFTEDAIELVTSHSSKFKIGDRVKVCKQEEDPTNWGYYTEVGDYCEKIVGVANAKDEIASFKLVEGRTYCKLKNGGYFIHEDRLSFVQEPKEEKQIFTEYAGLKVGDYLPEVVINKWCNQGMNRICLSDVGASWMGNGGCFVGDREILSFKNIDGVVGFEVSGTASVYLRADGFKAFMDKGLEKKEEQCTKPDLTLVPGRFYSFKTKHFVEWIIEIENVEEDKIYVNSSIATKSQSYYSKGLWGYLSSIDERMISPATDEQISWLLHCKSLGRFVTFDEYKYGSFIGEKEEQSDIYSQAPILLKTNKKRKQLTII